MAFLNKNQIIDIRERDRFTFFSFSNLVSFCFFARFTTDNVPKAGAKLGQKTKNQRHGHKNPSLKKKKNYQSKSKYCRILSPKINTEEHKEYFCKHIKI